MFLYYTPWPSKITHRCVFRLAASRGYIRRLAVALSCLPPRSHSTAEMKSSFSLIDQLKGKIKEPETQASVNYGRKHKAKNNTPFEHPQESFY